MKPVSLSLASLAALLSGVSGLARVSSRSAPNPNCFPFGSQARLNADLQPPHVSREDWWCPQSDFYGFLGFSFPFQFTNEDFEVASISSHMQQMKRQFGATMIRMYIPESYTTQLWENVLEAAILNNMGVVVQVAFPISGNDASLFNNNECYASLQVLANQCHSSLGKKFWKQRSSKLYQTANIQKLHHTSSMPPNISMNQLEIATCVRLVAPVMHLRQPA